MEKKKACKRMCLYGEIFIICVKRGEKWLVILKCEEKRLVKEYVSNMGKIACIELFEM